MTIKFKWSVSVLAIILIFASSKFLIGHSQQVDNISDQELSLNWQIKDYSDFGYDQHGDETQITVHDNGNAQIAVYHAETPYISYYNKETEEWEIVDSSFWEHGAPEILFARDGVFLAKITGMANIISSYDGIEWHNAGFSRNARNAMATGAYDVQQGVGVVSWWYNQSPIYYSSDSLTERTEWTLATGTEESPIPIFRYLTAHKGSFVGYYAPY